ncbi:MAG: hypothetical protein AAF518_17205 [Spirochaetota bacterium]
MWKIANTILLATFILCNCQKDVSKAKQGVSIPQGLSDEQAIELICKQVYQAQLKQIKISKTPEGYYADIDFGGSSAFTFLNRNNYKSRVYALTALYLFRVMQAGKKYNLQTIRSSLSKPFHVKHKELKQEIVEEFEVLRVKSTREKLEKITGWNTTSAFSRTQNGGPSQDVFKILGEIPKHWQVELDELYRIEIK